MSIPGRILLNIWRVIKSEAKLTCNDVAGVLLEVMGVTVPNILSLTISNWWKIHIKKDIKCYKRYAYLSIKYTIYKNKYSLLLLDYLEILPRSSQLSRVFGMDLWSVLSRGSQFRVESVLMRVSRKLNYILVSPNKAQVSGQPAIECIPLVLEPESAFYSHPVAVLDFQSLYPSIIIGYNICYSTCLGYLKSPKNDPIKNIGTCSLVVTEKIINEIRSRYRYIKKNKTFINGLNETSINGLNKTSIDGIRVLPNSCMYVDENVRKGILPIMLEEILNTRIMVKNAIKKHKNDEIYNILNHRQFGLKMIANVTYGYTSASFSGRMPSSVIADSIVQTARMTLERAMKVVEDNFKYAKIVYGDTDSLFIEIKNKNINEAFYIAKYISKLITNINPSPIKLQMEKIYYPCFLLSKKRYVGYKWENENGPPVIESKGIETIRRDQCAATSRILEKIISKIFKKQDISYIKSYLLNEYHKILSGKINIKDFIFHKEVKLGNYAIDRGGSSSTLPPQAVIALQNIEKNKNNICYNGERILYVIANGSPNSRIIDQVVRPDEIVGGYKYINILSGDGFMMKRLCNCCKNNIIISNKYDIYSKYLLNTEYYITKQINASINRLTLVGFNIDVNKWFENMPKPVNRMRKQQKTQYIMDENIKKNNDIYNNIYINNNNIYKNNFIDNFGSKAPINAPSKMTTMQLYVSTNTCKICGKNIEKNLKKNIEKSIKIEIKKEYIDIDEDIYEDTEKNNFCENCNKNYKKSLFLLGMRRHREEKTLGRLRQLCYHCAGSVLEAESCQNAFHCRIYFRKLGSELKLRELNDW
eukprot:GHVL01012346.1.p1 GENE.GHVL01012346.1~~GHVL01012346.1.p1  ORF type:complete len:898 (+),score=282.58 GHVL01012346.1:248-2695(+)